MFLSNKICCLSSAAVRSDRLWYPR